MNRFCLKYYQDSLWASHERFAIIQDVDVKGDSMLVWASVLIGTDTIVSQMLSTDK